jgi:hypothetical protein
VAIPLGLVRGALTVTLPPPEATVNVTVTFDTGFPNASVTNAAGAVATTVPTRATWLLPLLTERVAAAAAFTVTTAVCVIAVPPAVAEMVLGPAPVELKVVVNTPLPLPVPEVGDKVLPVPPVAAAVTAAPPIALLKASRAMTVMVEAVDPATQPVEQAVIVPVVATTED